MFSSDTDFGLIDLNEFNASNGDYPYSSYPDIFPINLIRVNNRILDWFQTANRDTSSFEGLRNVVYLTTLFGHEINHWGESSGRRAPFEKTGLPGDAGDYFEHKFLNGRHYEHYQINIGEPGAFTNEFNSYVRANFSSLSNIFK